MASSRGLGPDRRWFHRAADVEERWCLWHAGRSWSLTCVACVTRDPITEFVECLLVNFDFDSAQEKLRQCEK
eukprot:2677247-Rhodomonas_salina.2